MKTSRHWILDGKTPVAVDDTRTWAEQFEKIEQRRVQKTKFGDVEISTVFLGLDHSFGMGPPLLFETMIFGGKHDQFQDRYSTWDAAEKGHAQAIEIVKGSLPCHGCSGCDS